MTANERHVTRRSVLRASGGALSLGAVGAPTAVRAGVASDGFEVVVSSSVGATIYDSGCPTEDRIGTAEEGATGLVGDQCTEGDITWKLVHFDGFEHPQGWVNANDLESQ